jgi:hypothetical protein
MRVFASTTNVDQLSESIRSKANEVRELKSSKSDQVAVQNAVASLLLLKKEYLEITGTPFDPPKVTKSVAKEAKEVEVKQSDSLQNNADSLVITPRSVDYSAW